MDLAERFLQESQAGAHRLGNAALAGASANDVGNLYAATARPEQANRLYAEAVGWAEAAGDGALAATAEANAARLALERRAIAGPALRRHPAGLRGGRGDRRPARERGSRFARLWWVRAPARAVPTPGPGLPPHSARPVPGAAGLGARHTPRHPHFDPIARAKEMAGLRGIRQSVHDPIATRPKHDLQRDR